MHILILEHEPDAPAALLGEWAGERGHAVMTLPVRDLDAWPDPQAFDAVVSLGSEASVHASPDPWIAEELRYLERVWQAEVPILGICFGAQLLSNVLGAEVRAAPSMRVGWSEVASGQAELITPGPWFFWHSDCFGLPRGARLLAGNETQTTAFSAGLSLGVQFHPEVDAAVVRGWIESGHDQLHAAAVDRENLERQIAQHGPVARGQAFALFDRIVAWWQKASASLATSLPAPDKEIP